MRVKTVKRYYCDFCKKSTGTVASMQKHEKHCTNNPDRECGMCFLDGGGDYSAHYKTSILVERFKDDNNMLELRKATNGCPSCMYSVLRQCGVSPDNDLFVYHEEREKRYKLLKKLEAERHAEYVETIVY